jgi:hypothetical protein
MFLGEKMLKTVFVFSVALSLIAGCTAMEAGKRGDVQELKLKGEKTSVSRDRTVTDAEKRGELQALKHKEKRISISRGRIFEECVKLIPHQVMEYSFQAAKPLDFNVHYHDKKSTFSPVDKMSIAQWTGLIDVDREQYYSEEQKYFCLI